MIRRGNLLRAVTNILSIRFGFGPRTRFPRGWSFLPASIANMADVNDESLRTLVARGGSPLARFAVYGLIVLGAGLAVWLGWPQVRRAAIGWRSILDGLSVQRALSADLSADDEFAKAAFAEFSRLSPEADVGQLHLHLVRPGLRDGWSGADERAWLLNEKADLRPWRSTSYFPSDTRISEAYADFLEQLKFELVEDQRQQREIESLRHDFTQALKEVSIATSAASAKTQKRGANAQGSVERLLMLQGRFNEALGKLPRIGQVERAYLDFIGFDSRITVKTPSGEVPAARADLYPSFEDWMTTKRSVRRVNQVHLARVRPVPRPTSVTTQPEEELLLDLDANEVAVFRISRRPWFHEELLAQFRATARGSGLFGAEGSLGAIPVGLIFARGLTVSIKSPSSDLPNWRGLLERQHEITLELPGSFLSLPLGGTTLGADRPRSVRFEDAGDVKLIGVICRWL